jgi:hypothetical protein
LWIETEINYCAIPRHFNSAVGGDARLVRQSQLTDAVARMDTARRSLRDLRRAGAD